ncbi:hypothetical protein H5410_036255 [Solanum commersonii]|uniref:Uncharacterized protein n=1 Tax=Solanum commersonii TaxID=4109 RepID=A0A9J5Y548_SOLCO|nr:hypothetical protein H5410_036255 [Solanum commersonii]
MDNEIQKLKTNEDNLKSKASTSQQQDHKNAELSRSEDFKNPELRGTKKLVIEKQRNANLNQLFEKPFTQKTKNLLTIEPQTSTHADSLQHEKKVYNHITRTYIENIYKIQTYLNCNPRSTTTKDLNQDYITQKLQGYNKLIAKPKTNGNLVKTCYNYGLISTAYTYDGEELRGIPELHKAFIIYRRVTKGNLFSVKFYTATAETLHEEIKPPIEVVHIGLTKDMIIP